MIRPNQRAWWTIGLACVAMTACGTGGQPTPSLTETPAATSPEFEFIERIRLDPYWASTERKEAIAAGRAFCDAVADSEANRGNNAAGDAVSLLVAKHGMEHAASFTSAARATLCP